METDRILLATILSILFLVIVFYYINVQQSLETKDTTIQNLEKETAELQDEINLLENEKEDLKSFLLNVSDTKESELRNPTWEELKTFLKLDDTNKFTYNESFDCSGFAIELFKRARNYGFRSAYVEISFERNSTGHALNAFQTTDKGLIFVDDEGNREGSGSDRIAYVKIGENYGTIYLNAVKETKIACDSCSQFTEKINYKNYSSLFDYNYFSESAKCIDFFNSCVDSYNKAVNEFNMGIRKYSYNQLKNWNSNLDKLYDELGGRNYFVSEWGEKVKNIEIYW